MSEKFDTIVIGAGQAGLSAGYRLGRAGETVRHRGRRRAGWRRSWLNRWDSLRLFTPSIRCSLPGMPWAGRYRFPTRTRCSTTSSGTSRQFELQVRLGVKVDGLFEKAGIPGHRGRRGLRRRPRDPRDRRTPGPQTPGFAGDLSEDIVQLALGGLPEPGTAPTRHRRAGGRRQQRCRARDGPRADPRGAGSGRTDRRRDPHRHLRGWQGRLMFPVIWWVWEHVLTERGRPGRKVQAEKITGEGRGVIRQKEKDIRGAGVRRTSRITASVDGRPRTRTARSSTSERGVVHRVQEEGLRVDRAARPRLVRPARRPRAVPWSASPVFRPGPGVPVHVELAHRRRVGKDAAYVVEQLDREPAAAEAPQPAVES